MALDDLCESQEIVEPETRAPGGDHDERRQRRRVRPVRRQPSQSTVLRKEDAVLAPRRAGVDQLKALAEERVERVRDPKESLRTDRTGRS